MSINVTVPSESPPLTAAEHGIPAAFLPRYDDLVTENGAPVDGVYLALCEDARRCQEYETSIQDWLRWCNREGTLILTGRERADRMEAMLRAHGIDPNTGNK